MTRLRIGTRGSALALWQSRYVAARLAEMRPDLAIELVEITSVGDRVLDVPLSHVEGTGFFTTAIEDALLAGEVDVAVHSCKDLPVAQTPGLHVAALPPRGPVEDVLCARNGHTLATLAKGARVGTCSTRRTAQVRRMRDDVEILPLRGNVPTRVARITQDLDAIVLARAGLERLQLSGSITEVFPVDVMLPAPAQGSMAVQCREGDLDVSSLLAVLDDGPTRLAVEAERTMLHVLGGGCSVPVGASAVVTRGAIHLQGGVFSLTSTREARVRYAGTDPMEVGTRAAEALLNRGAAEILAECSKIAASPTEVH